MTFKVMIVDDDPSIVVALSLPFSVLFAFLLMARFGVSANLMSLGGLAIAIGMMVDAAIVMVENVDRMLREAGPDEPRIHVVGRACRQVVRPIAFAVLIIVIVFLPLFTLKGVEGKTFRPLAFTVALAMIGSLVFAVFLVPVLANLLMRRPRGKGRGAPPPRDAAVVRALLVPYRPLLSFFIRRRWAAIALGAAILGVLAAGSKTTGFRSVAAAIRAMAAPAGQQMQTVRPQRGKHKVYQEFYTRYRKLADGLVKITKG